MRKTVGSIQYLRAVAALMVVLHHASFAPLHGNGFVIDARVGRAGVDIFFVISGFVMVYTTQSKAITPLEFIRSRIVRIVPLYWAVTLVMFSLATLFPTHIHTASSSPADLVRSLLFIPFWNSTSHRFEPIIGQGWTLNYEMFFYALFALSLTWPKRSSVYVLSMIVTIVAVGAVGHPEFFLGSYYTDAIIAEFGVGVLLAKAYLAEQERPWLLPLCFACSAIASPFSFLYGDHRAIYFGIPAFAVVSGALLLERRIPFTNRAMLELGDASYCLYLIHGIVIGACLRIAEKFFSIDGALVNLGFMAVVVVIAQTVAIGVYQYVERPALYWIRTKTGKRGVVAAART